MSLTVGVVFADSMEYSPFLDWVKTQNEYKEKMLFGNESVELTLSQGERKIKISGV